MGEQLSALFVGRSVLVVILTHEELLEERGGSHQHQVGLMQFLFRFYLNEVRTADVRMMIVRLPFPVFELQQKTQLSHAGSSAAPGSALVPLCPHGGEEKRARGGRCVRGGVMKVCVSAEGLVLEAVGAEGASGTMRAARRCSSPSFCCARSCDAHELRRRVGVAKE